MKKYFILIFVFLFSENSHFQPLSLNLKFSGTISSQSYKDYFGYVLGANYFLEDYNMDVGPFISYSNTTLAIEKSPINERGSINTFLIGGSIVYYPFSKFNIGKIPILPKLELNIGYDIGNYTNFSGGISAYEGRISKIYKSPRFSLDLGLIIQPSKKIYINFEVGYELRNLKIIYNKNIDTNEILSREQSINLNTDKIKLGLIFQL